MRTHRHRLHIVLATLLSLGLLAIMVGTASAHIAHAKVLSATPGIGSTVTQIPSTITVLTAENINPDPKKSNLFVFGPSGELISQGNASVSVSNPKQMSVSIKADGSGIYVVRWITVSALDGDPDEGAFGFTVKTNAGPVGNGSVTPPSKTSSSTSGIPLWVPILAAVLALLIGLGGGLALGRRTAVSSLATMRTAIAQNQQQKTPTMRP